MPKAVRKVVNLALQGGGAHGAYSWGVLDRLLEDDRLDIDGLAATSAGSMNAVIYAYGKMQGGTEGARTALHDFWKRISEAGDLYSPVKQMPWEPWLNMVSGGSPYNMDNSMLYAFFDNLTRTISPYQFNPFDANPLRDIIAASVDFEEIHACQCVKLFLSATNVHTGRVHIFKNRDISLDAVMASAALPFLFKAVEIDGQHYWDGGYMGNPAIYPLFYNTTTRDVLILHINPLEREEVPQTATDIHNRINEISFNSSLIKEMRSIAFVKKLLDENMLKEEYRDRFTNVLVHAIRADKALCNLSVMSKFNTNWQFLQHLRDLGRQTAEAWLEAHYDDVGVRDTVDLRAML